MKRRLLLIAGAALCTAAFAGIRGTPHPERAATPEVAYARADTTRVLDIEVLKQRWREGRYAEVLPDLLLYRKTQPYGRNEIVDYMIGTSACRIPEKRRQGSEFLAWILQNHPLDEPSRARVAQELEQCRASLPPDTVVPVLLVSHNLALSGPGVSGKMFYDVTRGEDLPFSNEPVEIVRQVPRDSLTARLFSATQQAEALAALQARLGSSYTVAGTRSFLFASTRHDRAALTAIGADLERFLDFFVRTYDLTPPDHLITIYLEPTAHELRQLAVRIHGLRPAYQSIGYSMRDDLSMVAVVPGRVYGTLAHELFHLVVRRDFGDIPPWLDEGMAALYEVSQLGPGGVRGLPNWRGKVLEMFWNERPTVDALVRMDWRGFENAEHDFESRQQSANHAMARYFVLFLQEHGQLPAVFDAFRRRPVAESDADPAESAAALLASVLQQPLDQVDAAFVSWFERLKD